MRLPNIKNKNVLIIGFPGSGKTYLSNLLKNDLHAVFHTDDYIKYGYKDSMYKCLSDVSKSLKNTIVEGVQGYRMLRKGVELNCYYPDIVIELKISHERMEEIYKKERDVKKIKYLSGFIKSQAKILQDYKQMKNKKPPEWIILENKF